MGKKKTPKQETAYTPALAAAATAAPSVDVEKLRTEYAQQTSLLQQQMNSQKSQYEQQLKDLETLYTGQGSLLMGELEGQKSQYSILSQQLADQQNQYSLLNNQLAQQQTDAKTNYEKQQQYYTQLMKEQEGLAAKQQEEMQRSLLEMESRQADAQNTASSLLNTDAARQAAKVEKKTEGAATATRYSNVTRNNSGYSLLRR